MPSTKLIAFRLLRDSSYDRRYASLVSAIQVENTTRFDEFTSAFFLYHVDRAQTLFTRLLETSDLYHDGSDMLFVMDLNTQERAHIGIDNQTMLNLTLDAGKYGASATLFGLAPKPNALGVTYLR